MSLVNLNFERHKILRLIKTQGREYEFTSQKLNSFNEPVGGESKKVTVPGVYHETQGYVTSKADTGANIKTKPDAQILCLMENVGELETGMVVNIQGKDYRLIDLRNISNLGVACDLSLELVLK